MIDGNALTDFPVLWARVAFIRTRPIFWRSRSAEQVFRQIVLECLRSPAGARVLSKHIAMFRMRKTLGTIRGLADGAVMLDPRKRDAMFFDRTYRAVVVHTPSRATLEERDLPVIKPGLTRKSL